MKNILKELLKTAFRHNLENFVSLDLLDEDLYLKEYASNVLKTVIEIEDLEASKKHLETQLTAINHLLESKNSELITIKHASLHIGIDECWLVNIISLIVTKQPYTEFAANRRASKLFQSEEEANDYITFREKIKVGAKYKIIDLGKNNDGLYNKDAKKFYGISDRKTEYCFDKDKIWEIKAVGYFEEDHIPLVEREFVYEDKNNDYAQENRIEWQLPRYLYKNVIFID